MKIKSLRIKNFKSIEDLVLVEPNPFSVFVGPNGAGKSNIFQALNFATAFAFLNPDTAVNFLANPSEFLKEDSFLVKVDFGSFTSSLELFPYDFEKKEVPSKVKSHKNFFATTENVYSALPEYKFFYFNRVPISLYTREIGYQPFLNQKKLAINGSNIEMVLRELFQNEIKREEIIEWLKILIPEFRDIEITASELSGEVSFVIYEKNTNKPFPKHLISDGTKNILALLTAVYQSDEPQFLCIEEPENGLHPYVIESLVRIFRNACKEKGHYIWVNTHSETLVRQLTADEIIVVDKKEGSTRVRQFQGQDMFGLKMDEAWLTNALGGGLP